MVAGLGGARLSFFRDHMIFYLDNLIESTINTIKTKIRVQ